MLIAYGNQLRGDDGVAHVLADRVAALQPALEVQRCHQLLPEMAEAVAQAERVLFVDAAVPGAVAAGHVTLRMLDPQGHAPAPVTHFFAPETVLALALALYGRCPPAALLTVSGAEFGAADALSAPVTAALSPAVDRALAFFGCSLPDS